MPQLNGFLALMDSASFMTVWYWLALIGLWSIAGRAVLGVPTDVITRAGRDPRGEAGMILLDWLSLCLPRWRFGRREGAIVLGLAGFVLASLITLGFGYGLEMAQALSLLAIPFAVLFLMRLRLASRLAPVIDAARRGASDAGEAAETALRRIVVHRRVFTLLSIVSVALAALWGTRWGLTHPNGF